MILDIGKNEIPNRFPAPTDFRHGRLSTNSAAIVNPGGFLCQPLDLANSFLAGSENHAPQVPPYREPPWGIGLATRKTIAVQCSLKSAT